MIVSDDGGEAFRCGYLRQSIVASAVILGVFVSEGTALSETRFGERANFTRVAALAAVESFTDVNQNSADSAAIASMIAQRIMVGRSATEFAPDAPITRGEFAIAVQRMFNLPPPVAASALPDIPLGTPVYSAAEAVAPYLNPLLLCPGCALAQNFMPNAEISRGQIAVALVSILEAQNKLHVLSPAETDTALASVADANKLSKPARGRFATALNYDILKLQPSNSVEPDLEVTRAQFATLLDGVQKRFGIPRVTNGP